MRLHVAHILLAIVPAIYADPEKSDKRSDVAYHTIVGRSPLILNGGPSNSSSLGKTPSDPSLSSSSPSNPLLGSSSPANPSLGSDPSLSSSPSNVSLGSTPDLSKSSSPANSSGTHTPSLKDTSKVTEAVSKSWEKMLEHALNATLATLPGLQGVADEIQKLVNKQLDNLENQTTDPNLQNAGDSVNKTAGVAISGAARANVTQNVTGEGEMQGQYANGTKCEAQAYVTLSATSLTTLSGLFVAMRTLEETVSKDGSEKTTKLVEKIKGCISYSMLSVIRIVATPEVTQCKVAPAQTVFSSRIESNMTLIGQMIAELKQNSEGNSSLTLNNTLSINANSTAQANLTKTTRKPCKSSHRLQGGKSGMLGNSAANHTGKSPSSSPGKAHDLTSSPLNASAGDAQYTQLPGTLPTTSTGDAQYIQGPGSSPSSTSTGDAQYIQGPASSPPSTSTGDAQYIQGPASSPPSTSTGDAQYMQDPSGPTPSLQKRNATSLQSAGPALYQSGSAGSDPTSVTSAKTSPIMAGPTASGPSSMSSMSASANSSLSGAYNSAFNASSWSSDDDENCDPTLPPLDDEIPHKKDATHHKKKNAMKEVEKCYNATIPTVTGVIHSNPKEGRSGVHLGKSSESKIRVNVASYVTIKSPTIYNFITQVNGGSGARTDDDDVTPPKEKTPGSGASYPGAPGSPGESSYPGAPTSPGGSSYPGAPTSPGESSYPGAPTSSGNSSYPGAPTSPGGSSYPGAPTSPGESSYPGAPTSPGGSSSSGYPSVTSPSSSPSGGGSCVCGADKETHLRIRSLEAQVASVHRMMRKRGLTEL